MRNVFATAGGALALAISMSATAVTVDVGSGSGQTGGDVDIPITVTGDGTTPNQSFRVAYDSSVIAAVSCPAAPGPTAVLGENPSMDSHQVLCTSTCAGAPPAGFDSCLNIVIQDQSGFNSPIPDGPTVLGPVTFTLAGTFGMSDVADLALFDADPALTASTDGQITFATGPSLTAAPASVDLVGGGSGDITLSATGGDVTGISCAYSGDSQISISGTIPGTIADGASASVTASCSGASAGNFAGSFDCTSTDGGNTATPITCAVGANPVPTFSPDNGGSLIIPVESGGQGTRVIIFGNSGNASYTVDGCTVSGTQFSTTTTFPVSVAPGATASVSVTATDDGTFPTGTISCALSTGATYSASLGVSVLPVIVPTLSQWGLMILALVMIGFGGLMVRNRGNAA